MYLMSILLKKGHVFLLLHKQTIKKQTLRKIYIDIRTETLKFSVLFKYTFLHIRNQKKARKVCFGSDWIFWGEMGEQVSNRTHRLLLSKLLKLIYIQRCRVSIEHFCCSSCEYTVKEKGQGSRGGLWEIHWYSLLSFAPPSLSHSIMSLLSCKNKLGLNIGGPSYRYCYSTTTLRLLDLGKVLRLRREREVVRFFLRLSLTCPPLS